MDLSPYLTSSIRNPKQVIIIRGYVDSRTKLNVKQLDQLGGAAKFIDSIGPAFNFGFFFSLKIFTDFVFTPRIPQITEEVGLYRLFAVVNHMGTYDSGHYINYVLHAGEQWFRCDDTYLTR